MIQSEIDTIEAIACGWIIAASGLDDQHVIMSHQDCPDPQGVYITLELMESGDTLGMNPEQFVDPDTGIAYEIGHWRFEGTIDAYRAGAYGVLTKTRSKLLLPSFYETLNNAGISAHLGNVESTPNLLNREWEQHASMPIIMHYVANPVDDSGDIGYFEHVGVTIDADHDIDTII